MHVRNQVCTLLIIATAGAAAMAAGPDVPMAEPVEYAHAGITIALPKGFESVPLSDNFEVFQAVKRKDKEPVQAVSLSAFPVAEKVAPQAFGDAMIADMKKDLAIRGLQIGKLVTMKVAGVPAAARRLSYRSRGVPSVAVGTCFIREAKGDEPRMAYVLLVQTTPKQEEQLLPIFAAVAKSISLTALRHPADLPVGELGATHVDYRLGYSIRLPLGWYAAAMPKGVEIARTDYLLGGLPMPKLRVIVDEVTTDRPAEKACAKAMTAAKAAALDHKLEAKVVSEGEATLDGVKGYGFVLRQAPKGEEDGGKSMLLMQRMICVPAETGGRRQYTVVMLAQGRGEETASKTMDSVCESFKLLKGAETKPTTSTAPAEKGGK